MIVFRISVATGVAARDPWNCFDPEPPAWTNWGSATGRAIALEEGDRTRNGSPLIKAMPWSGDSTMRASLREVWSPNSVNVIDPARGLGAGDGRRSNKDTSLGGAPFDDPEESLRP